MDDSPPTRRRQARERVIGFLYEAETKDVHPTVVIDELPVAPDPFAVGLAAAAGDHRHQIDHLIAGIAAPKWPLARMPAMDRAVLRLAVAELAFGPDTPTGVVLSEAADLAAAYSTDDSSRFVNGVLARAAELVRDDNRWPTPAAVLFDCDGVFRHWQVEPIRDAVAEAGFDPDVLLGAAFEPDRFRRATVGEITAEEWAAEIALEVAGAGHDQLDGLAAAWLLDNWTVDEVTIELAGRLRAAGVGVAMYSNASTRLEGDLEKMAIAELFDVVINSSRIGRAKPDIAGFERAAELVGEPVDRIVFVDDRAENVEGALDAGMQAVFHDHRVHRLDAVFARLGLLGHLDAAADGP